MQIRHYHRGSYFQEQKTATERYIIPYIQPLFPVGSETVVLEVGCGEGGSLCPFLERGCRVIGVDISENKINTAGEFFANHPLKAQLTLIQKDILQVNSDSIEPADLIVMRDTLEHIDNQDRLLIHLQNLLKPGGRIFLSFPPWRMPFGGHQQMCVHRLLCRLPYFHLLPAPAYAWVLKKCGESREKVRALLEIKETRISIRQFKQLVRNHHLKIEREDFYLINPNYEVKFRLKPLKLPFFLSIPYFRDYMITTCYYLVRRG